MVVLLVVGAVSDSFSGAGSATGTAAVSIARAARALA